MKFPTAIKYRIARIQLVNLSNFARAYRTQLIGSAKICGLKQLFQEYKIIRLKLPLHERKKLGAQEG